MYKAGKLLGLPIADAVLAVTVPAWGLSASQVAQVAKAVTVEIKTDNSIGSGVLVAKNSQGYTVLTAAHVVNADRQYQLIAPDGRSYGIDRSPQIPKRRLLIICGRMCTSHWEIDRKFCQT
jgi:S1-C subfamily serine protease